MLENSEIHQSGHYFSSIYMILISIQMLQANKEKIIYHTLNMLSVDVTKKCLVGEGWSPVFATTQVIDTPPWC